MTDNQVKKLLNKTWYAFFGRHPRLRQVQAESAQPVFSGKSTLLASATASGKTEAYMAPLCERWFDDMRQGIPRVIVVSPTRALTNDLKRRLENPLSNLFIVPLLRTGDHPNPISEKKAGVILTTPESLDSLISRRARDLGTIRAIVLDELHVLEGTTRGDQLQILLNRLEKIVKAMGGDNLQKLVVTATVGFADLIAEKYLGKDHVIISCESARKILVKSYSFGDICELPKIILKTCRDFSARKVLAFVPSRAEAEELSVFFNLKPPFLSSVFVHHGSLSREERERVEELFQKNSVAICFATPTLEVGIDIGTVDLVALVGPPPDVSSLLQRIGRGNRRQGNCQVLALSSTANEKYRFQHLLCCAEQNRLLTSVKPFRSSVLVQQIFSMCLQNSKGSFITANAFHQRLPESIALKYPLEKCELLLDNLVDKGYLVNSGYTKYVPSDKLQLLFDRGSMHHNLSGDSNTNNSVNIVDSQTGHIIGVLEREADGSLPHNINIGGATRQIISDHGDHVRADISDKKDISTKFVSKGRPETTFELAQDFAEFLGFAGTIPYFTSGDHVIFAHFLGSNLGRVLNFYLKGRLNKKCSANDYLASVPAKVKWPEAFNIDDVILTIRGNSKKLAANLGLGFWYNCLPSEWLYEEIAQQAKIELLCKTFNGTKLVKADKELEDILYTFTDNLYS